MSTIRTDEYFTDFFQKFNSVINFLQHGKYSNLINA